MDSSIVEQALHKSSPDHQAQVDYIGLLFLTRQRPSRGKKSVLPSVRAIWRLSTETRNERQTLLKK